MEKGRQRHLASDLPYHVRHTAWTRELVQTAVERGAFGRAAREVLRQTPTLVAPGETRAEEAGAILAVAVSGHAVVTTIHARSGLRAVQRLADCAAMPGAYIYEGRRDHAIEDICDNFQVVIHLEKVAGRRYISEVLLLDGVTGEGEHPRPRAVRLAWAEAEGDGLVWRTTAQADGDRLVWPGDDRTPEALARRLRLLGMRADVRAAATTRGAVDEAVARATTATRAGDSAQALAILRRAWRDRRDDRLVAAARRALELDPAQADALADAGRRAEAAVADALRDRRWDVAGAAHEAATADVALVAAHTPTGGWGALADAVATGTARDHEAARGVERAIAALGQGRARDAVDILVAYEPAGLSPEVARAALDARRTALLALLAAGEVGPDALAPVEAALAHL